tara:strand:- start:631 stop:912 length:282 start_codon:yes stop_codon:yes gene_type:complete
VVAVDSEDQDKAEDQVAVQVVIEKVNHLLVVTLLLQQQLQVDYLLQRVLIQSLLEAEEPQDQNLLQVAVRDLFLLLLDHQLLHLLVVAEVVEE